MKASEALLGTAMIAGAAAAITVLCQRNSDMLSAAEPSCSNPHSSMSADNDQSIQSRHSRNESASLVDFPAALKGSGRLLSNYWPSGRFFHGAALAIAGACAGTAVVYLIRGRIFGPPFRSRVVGIIPARYDSSRFPGKPLVNILGKPMIQRTWEQAMKAKTLDRVVVATDDERIAYCCRGFGADVIMTSRDCANGTVRCSEAVGQLGVRKFDAVVNIQGDEPLVDPATIDGVVLALQGARDAVCSTAVTPLLPLDCPDPNRVKCVVDRHGYALYFSRALIPSNKRSTRNTDFPYLLHLGLMCYDAKFLLRYAAMRATPLQEEEDLEQLRILEYGEKIKVICVDHSAHGVDTPDDIRSIEAILKQRGGKP